MKPKQQDPVRQLFVDLNAVAVKAVEKHGVDSVQAAKTFTYAALLFAIAFDDKKGSSLHLLAVADVFAERMEFYAQQAEREADGEEVEP